MKVFILFTDYTDYGSMGWDDGAPAMKILLVSHDFGAIEERQRQITPEDIGYELKGFSTVQTWENGVVVSETEKKHSFEPSAKKPYFS